MALPSTETKDTGKEISNPVCQIQKSYGTDGRHTKHDKETLCLLGLPTKESRWVGLKISAIEEQVIIRPSRQFNYSEQGRSQEYLEAVRQTRSFDTIYKPAAAPGKGGGECGTGLPAKKRAKLPMRPPLCKPLLGAVYCVYSLYMGVPSSRI